MLKDVRDYINDNPKGYWFKAKLYGWGWTPVTWQAWITILLYLGGLALLSLAIGPARDDGGLPRAFGICAAILTVGFAIVLWKKGEKPRWQWGPPKKK